MPRLRAAMREHHAPGHIRGPAEQLAIDEVGDAAEEQADRDRAHHGIADLEEGALAHVGEQPHGEDHAEHAAVERHAALPDRERLERMAEIVTGPVEQHVAEPAAQHHAQRDVEQQIVDLERGQPPARALHQPAHVAPAGHQAYDVGERVPADREGSELDQDRIDRREGQREDRHGFRLRPLRQVQAHGAGYRRRACRAASRCAPQDDVAHLEFPCIGGTGPGPMAYLLFDCVWSRLDGAARRRKCDGRRPNDRRTTGEACR